MKQHGAVAGNSLRWLSEKPWPRPRALYKPHAWLCAAALVGSLSASRLAHATYSALAVDIETGEMGGFAASCIGSDFSLSEVITLRKNIGLVAAQGYFFTDGRDALVTEMEKGSAPADALASALERGIDPPGLLSGPEFRQYAVIDGKGIVAQHSGTSLDSFFGQRTGRAGTLVYAIQGNFLTDATVLSEMETALTDEGLDLPRKLVAALQRVAESGGGDERCAPLSADSGYFAHLDAQGRLMEVERRSAEAEVALLLADSVESELPAPAPSNWGQESRSDGSCQFALRPASSIWCIVATAGLVGFFRSARRKRARRT